jgi:chromosome segregation ATPase
MSLENLKLLEAKIDEFVDRHERVRHEHEEILQRLQEREAQLADTLAQLKQYERERVDIRTRLEHLLSRLAGLDLT